jgi:hypothetical protein
MKVKEKAETVAINGCMLTPGMRECKSDVYGVRGLKSLDKTLNIQL